MAVTYTTVDRIKQELPMVSSLTTVSSAQIAAFIENTDAVINGMIALNYTVPATGSGVPPLLQTICSDGVIYRILRRVFTQERLRDSNWPSQYKDSMDLLRQIAQGEIPLVDGSGNVLDASTAQAPITSNTKGYLPTFHEGRWSEQVQDSDKIEDIEFDRDLI